MARPVWTPTDAQQSGVSLAAVQNALNMLMPIGTIMAYGGNTRDANVVTALQSQGWLPCDGQSAPHADAAPPAEMTDRVCHAIEIAPAYVDVAVTRWQEFTGHTSPPVSRARARGGTHGG